MPKLVLAAWFKGVGRRKRAVAQVRLVNGSGKLTVNEREIDLPLKLKHVFELVDRFGQFDVSVIARGGGMQGQVDAIVLGVARALVEINPDWRSTLRKGGYLTRDARIKERKKPGLKKARKAPQWAKR